MRRIKYKPSPTHYQTSEGGQQGAAVGSRGHKKWMRHFMDSGGTRETRGSVQCVRGSEGVDEACKHNGRMPKSPEHKRHGNEQMRSLATASTCRL